ncbi:hypothetical protein ELB20_78 [Streptomyces phage phiELB20]|uniref:Uncharacterized protein n=1 Tax=Streptomyces phage phiELB20 TaxID=1211278 RepID=I7B3S1_9CAUD|nr:hypothetical protein FDG59_gp06 [Streptomyces phage phiELB20]AFO10944.1 hypothetical protein ELB20_78 [Streptomyces phage phiELB20]
MRAFLAGLAGLGVGCVLTWGLVSSPQAPPYPVLDAVQTFNQGFADSKQDDCDQGFAPACEWVMVLNGIPLPPDGV